MRPVCTPIRRFWSGSRTPGRSQAREHLAARVLANDARRGIRLTPVGEVAVGPDEYFGERGFVLRIEERNLDAELPRNAKSRGSPHWADLVSAKSGEVVARSYGAGQSVDEAKLSALKRWVVEQEPPASLPYRLP